MNSHQMSIVWCLTRKWSIFVFCHFWCSNPIESSFGGALTETKIDENGVDEMADQNEADETFDLNGDDGQAIINVNGGVFIIE